MKPSAARVSAYILASFGLLCALTFNVAAVSRHQHFAWLAESFWHGRLDIAAEHIAADSPIDISFRQGRYYWPLEPLPAVAMMPFVPFMGGDAQPIVQIIAVVGLALLAWRLARLTGFGPDDAVWLAFLFCFGSMAIGVISMNAPWFVGDVFAALCLLAALVEQRSKNRPGVVGLFAGLAWLARLTAGLGTVFFLLCELLGPAPRRAKMSRLWRLALPVAAGVVLAALYNYLRFGSPFDTGHSGHFLQSGLPEAARIAQHGLFSLAYVGRNFYYYFLKLPELAGGWPLVSSEGVSAWLLSPVFLLAFRARDRRPEFMAAVAASLPVLAVFLTYFTTGFEQFGPRYLLDILPYWYLLLLLSFRRPALSFRVKTFIAASAGLNIFLFLAFSLRQLFEFL